MLNKCANPACSDTFRRLTDGRVFVIEVQAEYQRSAGGSARQRQYFWLCNSCCRTMTVILDKAGRVQVMPLDGSATGWRRKSEECSDTRFRASGASLKPTRPVS